MGAPAAAMTLLLTHDGWRSRRGQLHGSLAALADGIAVDLEPVLARPLHIPGEKALLTRTGGRCERDGALLTFDPFAHHEHRCPQCGTTYRGAHHDGFWRYWYHLWLAERAVHAAVLHALRGAGRHAAFAVAVLEGYAAQYEAYPNADNVLGPGRVFFSTYLESIWLLQLSIALDALEASDVARFAATGALVRRAIIEPAVAIISRYDEGFSNRQVWNVAAQMAAARMLGDDGGVKRLVEAPHGLAALVEHGCLSDGTWYEGENYHMFAHRGLWYGVTMAERAGAPLPPALTSRFDAGFVAPFLTALPDMTLPSRRDSQYAISLRQPRFAEHCELGLARHDDPRLAGMLASLYSAPADVPRRDNGRAGTSADAERNLPAMQLSRADLGWRTLLFARAEGAPVRATPPRSVLLEGQGIAVLRRDAGDVYVALDYGHSGGGHGHPDRLNVMLMRAGTRLLDDMGTGSYVEPTLHWYRSTLAHNAPLVDGRSQRPCSGRLIACEDRGGAGWVEGVVDGAADGVRLERTIVAMPDYILDELRWTADREITVDLPCHAPLGVHPPSGWTAAAMPGGGGLEDGFEFLLNTARRPVEPGRAVILGTASDTPGGTRAVVTSDGACEWWRAEGPAAPGRGVHTFHVVRARGSSGRIRTAWCWSDDIVAVRHDAQTTVTRRDGTSDTHGRTAEGWRIELVAGAARSTIDLGGLVSPPDVPAVASLHSSRTAPRTGGREPAGLPFEARLGEAEYRRSEEAWSDAGRPTADVSVTWEDQGLHVSVRVRKAAPVVFVPEGSSNPLDNEPPEINGDGIQLYVAAGPLEGAWTIVPVEETSGARSVAVRGWSGLVLERARWAPAEGGYALSVRVPLPPDCPPIVGLGVIVNEAAPGRARRRGQLVLGGAEGEWVYLRGDRHDRERLIPVRIGPGAPV